jgi:hypothetical protein
MATVVSNFVSVLILQQKQPLGFRIHFLCFNPFYLTPTTGRLLQIVFSNEGKLKAQLKAPE